MKKTLCFALAVALAVMPSGASAEGVTDPTFSRMLEIDAEIDDLIAERSELARQMRESISYDVNYKTTYPAGTYKVGSDIPAGEYVFFATDNFPGSFKETTDSEGQDKVGSEYFLYDMIYTLTEGNYVEIENSYAVPSNQVDELKTQTGNGAFKVGTHIPAGADGHYRIYSSSLLTSDNKIDGDSFSSITQIAVHDGEYLIITGCMFAE